MITEDYVSFETAKLLKEKGFNELCSSLYKKSNGEYTTPKEYVFNGEWSGYILRPTQAIAMKWLREVHNINIEIGYNKNNFESFVMTIEDLPKCLCRDISSNKYEQAVEAGIKYCLENLI